MKISRTFLWALALMLAPALSFSGFAAPYQGGYGGGMGGRRGEMLSPADQLKRLSKELDLTADQQTKVKPILVDQRKKMDAVRDDTTLDRRTMRDKMMQIRQDANDQVRALLDDKQKDKFDKMQQEREDRMQNRRGGPGGTGGNNSGNAPPPPPQPQN